MINMMKRSRVVDLDFLLDNILSLSDHLFLREINIPTDVLMEFDKMGNTPYFRNFNYLIMYQELPMEFINKYIDKLDFNLLIIYQDLTEGFIMDNIHRVDFTNLSTQTYYREYREYSLDFLEVFKECTNWRYESSKRVLTPEFFNKFNNKIEWDVVVIFNESLTEDLIDLYHDKFDWDLISKHVNLSNDFVIRNSDKLNFYHLYTNNRISNEFKEGLDKISEWVLYYKKCDRGIRHSINIVLPKFHLPNYFDIIIKK